MTNTQTLRDMARNIAAAEMFAHMASEEKSQKLFNQLSSQPDEMLDLMAKISGVPDHHLQIYRAMVKGEKNPFTDGIEKIDGLLKTGDIVLMAGKSATSQKLINIQKKLYKDTRSSHVAIVHADFICIDAMPKIGVTNRLIHEILADAEDNWRVIRPRNLDDNARKLITSACVFYLAQPYRIRSSTKSAKTYSYCSELARKVYSNTGISTLGIPNNLIIKPSDFDKLADQQSQWVDVTEDVRPAVDFFRIYPELIKVASKLFIDGLKLNRQRFKERTDQLKDIRLAAKNGKISRDKMLEMIKSIKDIENNMNHTFWDTSRPD